jgi:CheY-like chemotaxis protein
MAPVVLVADDDPDDVLLLSRAFLTAGLPHRIVHVRNGQEAIRYLSGDAHYVDRFKYPMPRLLVLDLNTSRKHGLDLLDWLEDQSQLRTLPVVVISASDAPIDRQKADAFGVNAYRVKPAGLPGWVAIVKDIATRWLTPHPELRRRKKTPTEIIIPQQHTPEAVLKH